MRGWWIILCVPCSGKYAPDHSHCLVANLTDNKNGIHRVNQMLKLGSTAVNWIQRQLDPLALPVPIVFQMRNQFFGNLYQMDLQIENFRLHGLSQVELQPFRVLDSTSIQTGILVDSMYFDLQIGLRMQKIRRRKWGVPYCPDSFQFFLDCPVSRGLLRTTVLVRQAKVDLVLDVYIYDCERFHKNAFGIWSCRFKSALEYLFAVAQKGLGGLSDSFLSRFHDLVVRKSVVSFRDLDVDVRLENQYSDKFNPSIIGFLQTQINVEMEGGIFHESICRALGEAVLKMAIDVVEQLRPAFTQEHWTNDSSRIMQ